MDLFSVTRFTENEGNKDRTTNINTAGLHEETSEKNKLKKILNKIKVRKRRRCKTQEKEQIIEENLNNYVSGEVNSNQKLQNENFDSEDEHITKKPKITDVRQIEGFTILGVDKFDEKQKVERILPKWLRTPVIISTDLNSSCENKVWKTLNKSIKNNLEENNIKSLFSVQSTFIPWQLETSKRASLIQSQDACISAPTGSGKTLTFIISILEHFILKSEQRNMTVKEIRVLVILPTQSLAMQIYDIFKSYSAGTGLTVGVITSNNTTFKKEQKSLLTNNSVWGSSSRTDILVCTAGRLIDHLKNTKGFNLHHLEYIIIDEADQNIKQDDWLYHLEKHMQCHDIELSNNILNVCSAKRMLYPQKLLFSATLSSDPENIKKWSLFQPKLFTCATRNEELNELNNENFIGKYTLPTTLTEKYVICSSENKPLVLYNILKKQLQNSSLKVLVFVNDTDTCHRLGVLMCMMMKSKLIVKEMSTQTNKENRKDILNSFSKGEVNVLICTNFMARGTDIPNVDCVISYDAPTHLITYVHRAGRTARAGIQGLCITMVENTEEKKFFKMLNECTQKNQIEEINIPFETLQSLSTLYKGALRKFKLKIGREKMSGISKLKRKKLVKDIADKL